MKCNFNCINFIKISKLSVIIFLFLKAMGKRFMQVVSFLFPFSDICGIAVMPQASLVTYIISLSSQGEKKTNCKVEIINSIVSQVTR